MKTTTNGAVFLCEYCQRPFHATPTAPPAKDQGPPAFILCPMCSRHRRSLVPVTCAQCGCVFPRHRYQVKVRGRCCKRAFCPACHTVRQQPKTFKATCSECGRGYRRTLRAERASEYRGHRRRICPICQPAKMVMITCCRCRRQFHRKLAKVHKKQREGKRRAVCPRCHDRSTTKQPQPKGGSK